eukprot:8595255-Pyramimonas_sp.AAC.1
MSICCSSPLAFGALLQGSPGTRANGPNGGQLRSPSTLSRQEPGTRRSRRRRRRGAEEFVQGPDKISSVPRADVPTG